MEILPNGQKRVTYGNSEDRLTAQAAGARSGTAEAIANYDRSLDEIEIEIEIARDMPGRVSRRRRRERRCRARDA